MINCLFGRRKSLTRKSHQVPKQIYAADGPSVRYFECQKLGCSKRSVRARIGVIFSSLLQKLSANKWSCMRTSKINHLSWSYTHLLKHRYRTSWTFTRTNRHESLLSHCQIMGVQREQIFFTAKCSFKIECIAVEPMPIDDSISWCVTWRYYIIS